MDVIITICGFQFKDVVNVTSLWMMLNEVIRLRTFGEFNSTNFVLDVFQLFTIQSLRLSLPLSLNKCLIEKDLFILLKGNGIFFTLSVYLGANMIKWTNGIIIKNDCMFFFPQKTFSYEWILEQFFWQLVIINAYSCPSTWHVFFSSFFNKYEF